MHGIYHKFLGPIADFAIQNEYLGIFLLLFLGVLIVPLPVEAVMLFVGYRINKGAIDFLPALLAVISGSMTATLLGYGFGRFISIAVQHKLHSLFRITKDKREYVSAWFRQLDEWGPIFGYFLPIFRHFIGPIAGISKFRFIFFFALALLGATIWSLVLLFIGLNASKNWHSLSRAIHHPLILIGVVVVLVVLGNLWLHVRRKDSKS